MKEQPYFQKQGTLSLQCGMHCINNLLKTQAYTIKKMQQICYSLSDNFINPHKHPFGGDYDANVIIVALQQQGCECEWLDRRKGVRVGEFVGLGGFVGFLVNLPMPKKLYHRIMGFSSRHWVSVRLAEGGRGFELCDSLEEETRIIPDEQKLEKYLKDAIANEGQIFWVHRRQKQ